MDSSCFSFNHPFGACPVCKGLGNKVDVDLDKIINADKSLNENAILHHSWHVGTRNWNLIKTTGFFDMDQKLRDYSKEDFDKLLYSPPTQVKQKDKAFIQQFSFEGIVSRLQRRNTGALRSGPNVDKYFISKGDCPECNGWRLKKNALDVKINEKNIGEVGNMSIAECLDFVKTVKHEHAKYIKPRLTRQLQFLIDTGIGYLSLNRSTDTLSGGEIQRVKLARQLGSDLIETIYVLDEPTAGLHPRDVGVVTTNLRNLVDSGNSVLVVEHDLEVISISDHLVELGPGGGRKGGEIIYSGTVNGVRDCNKSVTRDFLFPDTDGRNADRIQLKRRKPAGYLKIEKARRNNLKNITVDIPTGILVAITGVSGAGKSSLAEEIVAQHTEEVTWVNQSPVGKTSRGSVATYVGAFDHIRKLFARKSGQSISLFSYNGKGACEECKGLGYRKLEMAFLGDIKIECAKCAVDRYKPEILEYEVRGKNISDVLKMTVEEAVKFFKKDKIKDKLTTLVEVGLDYIELGQTLNTLSGGESQRLKLASRLADRDGTFILDEPTFGLHPLDVEKLVKLLNRIVNTGNTVIVIEHDVNVIKHADWVIDLGPEGGDAGGYIVAQGKPEDIVKVNKSYTGRFLKLNLRHSQILSQTKLRSNLKKIRSQA